MIFYGLFKCFDNWEHQREPEHRVKQTNHSGVKSKSIKMVIWFAIHHNLSFSTAAKSIKRETKWTEQPKSILCQCHNLRWTYAYSFCSHIEEKYTEFCIYAISPRSRSLFFTSNSGENKAQTKVSKRWQLLKACVRVCDVQCASVCAS